MPSFIEYIDKSLDFIENNFIFLILYVVLLRFQQIYVLDKVTSDFKLIFYIMMFFVYGFIFDILPFVLYSMWSSLFSLFK